MRPLPKPRRALRTAGLAAATPLLLISLAACGGGDADSADDPAGDATSAATSAATDAATEATDDDATAETEAAEPTESESADVSAGSEIDTGDFVDQVESGVGEMTTAHVSMTMGGVSAMKAEGDIDYQKTPPAMQMTMTVEAMGTPMEIRLLDGVFYMNMGQMSGGKFYEFDTSDPNSPLGDVGDLTSSMDPAKSFDQFEAGIQKVTVIGDDEIDGDAVTHYRMALDTSKIAGMSGGETAGMPKKLDYDVWLDSDNRMRKVEMNMGKQLGTMSMTTSKLGEPVTIEAPAKSEIAKYPAQ